jgi:hypothetical protein
MIDLKFIESVEKAHFRTNEDTGANPNALLIWNLVRKNCGLAPLSKDDLPAYCQTHKTYHHIKPDNGCERVRIPKAFIIQH